MSPQQQNQILNDVQQHRFQQTSAQRHLQSLQQYDQPSPQETPPPIEQSLSFGQQPFLTNAQYLAQLRQQQQHLQLQQQRQPQYHAQQVIQQRPPPIPASSPPVPFQPPTQQILQQSQVNPGLNINLRNQFQQEYNRLLASQQFVAHMNSGQNINQEIPVYFPQPQDFQQAQQQQPQQTYEFEPAPSSIPTKTSFKHELLSDSPTYKFEPAPEQPNYKFEPAPPKPSKYEPTPSTKPTYKFEPAPPKPTYKLESAPTKPNNKFEQAPTKATFKHESNSFVPTQPTTRHTTYNYLKKKKAALTTTTPATSTYSIPYRLRPKLKTTTESPKPQVSIRPTQILIKPDRQQLLQQLLEAQQQQNRHTTTSAPAISFTPKQNVFEFDSEDALQKHIQQQLQKQGLLEELKGTIPATSDQIDALPNLDFLSLTNSSSPIILPNGQNIKIIQVPSKIDPNTKKPTPQIKTIVINQPTTTTTTTTVKPPDILLKELTSGLPGDFEIIRQTQDGGLEELGTAPQGLPQKKVTFVILEEQPDGSLKVQGVRGNENGLKEDNGEEVQSIIQKIEKGEIKLPKSTKSEHEQPSYSNSLANATPEESVESPSYIKHSGKSPPKVNTFQPTPAPPQNYFEPSTKPNFNYKRIKSTAIPQPAYQPSSTPYTTTASSPNTHGGPVFAFPSSTNLDYHLTSPRPPSNAPSFLPTLPSTNAYSTNSVDNNPKPTAYPAPVVSTTSQYSQVNISPQNNNYDDQLYKQLYQQNNVYQPTNSQGSGQVYQPEAIINQPGESIFPTMEPLPIQQVTN